MCVSFEGRAALQIVAPIYLLKGGEIHCKKHCGHTSVFCSNVKLMYGIYAATTCTCLMVFYIAACLAVRGGNICHVIP